MSLKTRAALLLLLVVPTLSSISLYPFLDDLDSHPAPRRLSEDSGAGYRYLKYIVLTSLSSQQHQDRGSALEAALLPSLLSSSQTFLATFTHKPAASDPASTSESKNTQIPWETLVRRKILVPLTRQWSNKYYAYPPDLEIKDPMFWSLEDGVRNKLWIDAREMYTGIVIDNMSPQVNEAWIRVVAQIGEAIQKEITLQLLQLPHPWLAKYMGLRVWKWIPRFLRKSLGDFLSWGNLAGFSESLARDLVKDFLPKIPISKILQTNILLFISAWRDNLASTAIHLVSTNSLPLVSVRYDDFKFENLLWYNSWSGPSSSPFSLISPRQGPAETTPMNYKNLAQVFHKKAMKLHLDHSQEFQKWIEDAVLFSIRGSVESIKQQH